jgi:hypothetical protein
MAEATGFWAHCRIVAGQAFRDFAWARDMALATILAAATLVIQVIGRLISVQDWQQHKTLWVVSIVGPYIVVLAVHISWRLLTAPWRVHQEQERHYIERINTANQAISGTQRELKKWQSASPRIDMQIGALIASKPLETGVQGLFLLVDLTLIEPAEVQIDAFKLEIVDGVGVKWEAMFVDDLEDWTRLMEDPEKHRMVNYPKAVRKLTQRGDKVTCCLHFFFMMSEAKLFKVDLVLKVVTPYGTCSAQVKGANAFPDVAKKGRMLRRDSYTIRNLLGA